MYRQEVRGPKKAIYAQYFNNVLIAYEVVRIRVHPPKYNQFLKREETKKEQYPTNEQWGKFGWTFKSREKAIEKFNQIE
jgi:hypothetical protein